MHLTVGADLLPLSKLSRLTALELVQWAASHVEACEPSGETLAEYEARTTYRLPKSLREPPTLSEVARRRKWNNYHQPLEADGASGATGRDER
jgi:hypothetical protein